MAMITSQYHPIAAPGSGGMTTQASNMPAYVVVNQAPEVAAKQQHLLQPPNASTYSAPAKFGAGTPLKPPKRLRKDDNQITRCKRRLDFAKLGLPVQRHSPVVAAKRNERERNRVRHINDTFTVLRDHLPNEYNTAPKPNKELSKVEILRAAIDYIQTLETMLAGKLQLSDSVDLKALIQASTSPDSKTPEKTREVIAKFFGKNFQLKTDVSGVASPAPSFVSNTESFCDESPVSTPYEPAGKMVKTMTHPPPAGGFQSSVQSPTVHSTNVDISTPSHPINSDLNDNFVNKFGSTTSMTSHNNTGNMAVANGALAPQQPALQTGFNNYVVNNNIFAVGNDQSTVTSLLPAFQQNVTGSPMKLQNNFAAMTPNNELMTSSQHASGTYAWPHKNVPQLTMDSKPPMCNTDVAYGTSSAYGQPQHVPSPVPSTGSSAFEQNSIFETIDFSDIDFTSMLMSL